MKTMETFTCEVKIDDRTFTIDEFQKELNKDPLKILLSNGSLFGEINPDFDAIRILNRTPLSRIVTVECNNSMIRFVKICADKALNRLCAEFQFTNEETAEKFKKNPNEWVLVPRWVRNSEKFTLITFDLYFVGNQIPEINTTAKLHISSPTVISERNDNESEVPPLQNVNIDINIPEELNSTQEVEVDLSDSRIKFDCLVDTIDCDEKLMNLIQKGGLLGESYYDLASTDLFRVYAYTCTNPIRAYYIIKGYRFDYKNERLFITIDWLDKSFAKVYNEKPEDWRFVPRIIWDEEQMKAIPSLMDYVLRNGYCLITFDITISKELERRFNAFTKGPIDGGGLI